MNALAPATDFPASRQSTYLNSASVALMCRGCQDAIDDWNRDLAENGAVNFNEHAEQTIHDDLHHSQAPECGVGRGGGPSESSQHRPRREWFRFSPHLYNSADDVDAALAELNKLER